METILFDDNNVNHRANTPDMFNSISPSSDTNGIIIDDSTSTVPSNIASLDGSRQLANPLNYHQTTANITTTTSMSVNHHNGTYRSIVNSEQSTLSKDNPETRHNIYSCNQYQDDHGNGYSDLLGAEGLHSHNTDECSINGANERYNTLQSEVSSTSSNANYGNANLIADIDDNDNLSDNNCILSAAASAMLSPPPPPISSTPSTTTCYNNNIDFVDDRLINIGKQHLHSNNNSVLSGTRSSFISNHNSSKGGTYSTKHQFQSKGKGSNHFPKLAPSHDPVSDVNLTLQYLCRNILDETVILDNGFTKDKQGPQTIYRCKCVLVVTKCSLSKILDFKQRQTDKTVRPQDVHSHRTAFVHAIQRCCREMTLEKATQKFGVSDMVKVNLLSNLSKAQSCDKGVEGVRNGTSDVVVYIHTEDGGHDKKKREAKRKACQELLSTLRNWVYEGMLSRNENEPVKKIDLLKGLPNVREESSYDSAISPTEQKSSIKHDEHNNRMQTTPIKDDEQPRYYSLCLNGDRELKDVISYIKDQRIQLKLDTHIPFSRCQCHMPKYGAGVIVPPEIHNSNRACGVLTYIPSAIEMGIRARHQQQTHHQNNPIVVPSNPYNEQPPPPTQHQHPAPSPTGQLCYIPTTMSNAPHPHLLTMNPHILSSTQHHSHRIPMFNHQYNPTTTNNNNMISHSPHNSVTTPYRGGGQTTNTMDLGAMSQQGDLQHNRYNQSHNGLRPHDIRPHNTIGGGHSSNSNYF